MQNISHFRYRAKFLRNNFKRTYSLSVRAKTTRTKTTRAKEYAISPGCKNHRTKKQQNQSNQ
jgi:hypothetical protein